MEQRPAMRVGDRDRGEVADLLRRHVLVARAAGVWTLADDEPLPPALPR